MILPDDMRKLAWRPEMQRLVLSRYNHIGEHQLSTQARLLACRHESQVFTQFLISLDLPATPKIYSFERDMKKAILCSTGPLYKDRVPKSALKSLT